jgi:hypothetical protein
MSCPAKLIMVSGTESVMHHQEQSGGIIEEGCDQLIQKIMIPTDRCDQSIQDIEIYYFGLVHFPLLIGQSPLG